MDSRHITILRKSRMIFLKNLTNIENVCDRLYAYGVLTEGMIAEIKSGTGIEAQSRNLLDILPRRGSHAYDFFYQALIETSQQELADILKPELSFQVQSIRSKQAECKEEFKAQPMQSEKYESKEEKNWKGPPYDF